YSKTFRSHRGDFFLLALQFLPRLKTNRLPGRNRNLLAGARVSPDTAFTRLDHEHAKAAQLDAVAARQRVLHRMKQGIDGLLGFELGNACAIGETIDDIEFDHGCGLRGRLICAGDFNQKLPWLTRGMIESTPVTVKF